MEGVQNNLLAQGATIAGYGSGLHTSMNIHTNTYRAL